MRRVLSPNDVLGFEEPKKQMRQIIDDRVIEEMLDSVDIIEILENEYGLVLEEGHNGWFNCNCPMPDHRDSNPSFGINPETGFYNCFGCNGKGNLLTFVRKIEGISYREALAKLSVWSGIGPDSDQGEIHRAVRDVDIAIREFLGRDTESKLPGGMSIEQFMISLCDRLEKYLSKVDQDEEEYQWVENLYREVDDLDSSEDELSLRKVWKRIGTDMQNRFISFQERHGLLN